MLCSPLRVLCSSRLSLVRHFHDFDPNRCKIGIIGLGHVGKTITDNLLQKNYTIHRVLDNDPAKLSNLPKEVKVASCPREVGKECDVTFTTLPTPIAVKNVLEGDEGLLAGMDKGKIWVDHTSTDHQQTKVYAETVENKGGHVLEAPITGGMTALKKGQMITYIGGDKNVLEKVRPLLEVSFQNVFYLGQLGNATITKIATNMLCASQAIAMGEMLMFAKKANIDLHTFWDAVRLSVGNSFTWETAAPTVFNGHYDTEFSIELFCKDMHLGYGIAKELNVPIPMMSLTQVISNQAMHRYGKNVGCYSQVKLLEDNCHESLQMNGFEDWTYDLDTELGSAVVKHTFKK